MTITPRTLSLCLLLCASLLPAVLPARADTDTSFGDRSGEGSTPFTGLAQTPEANLFTGALGTAIPIAVPPGHKNATPALALQYSSAGGPSPFGYGWDLPIGRIDRTTKWGVPRCASSHFDEFVLSMPGTNAELVNDPPGTAIYRPRVEESYVKAELNLATNSWTVQDRAGMRYEFGTASGARVGTDTTTFATVHPNGECTYTTAWALTKIIDPDGNTIQFTWASLLNQLVPIGVQYGGNEATRAAHRYTVIFNYEGRPDQQRSYRHGEAAYLWLRLNSVDVGMQIPGPETTPITRYQLVYDDDQPGQRSLLRSVATTGRPTQTFSYAPSATGHAEPVAFSAPKPFLRSHDDSLEVKNTVLDMNGDGFLDYVHWTGTTTWDVWFGGNQEGAFGFASSKTGWTVPNAGVGALIRNVEVDDDACPGNTNTKAACTVADTFDITGDGIADYVVATAQAWRVYPGRRNAEGGWEFNTGAGAYPAWPAPSRRIRHTTANGARIRDVIDMNGDGLPDLVIANQDPWQVYLNTGAGFEATAIPFAVPADWQSTVGIPEQFTDFNGDGLPDFIRWKAGHTALTGTGQGPQCLLATTSSYVPYTTGEVIYSHDCIFVYFNTGSGFDATPKMIETAYGGGRRSYSGDNYQDTVTDLLDVNGDGLPDEVYAFHWNEATHTYDPQWSVRLNTGGDLEPLAVSSYGPEVWNQTGEFGLTWGYAGRVWTGGQGPLRTTRNRRDLADMVDLDGDGLLDRVVAGTTGEENPDLPATWLVQRNRAGAYDVAGSEPSQRPNLMTMMSNGFGGTNAILYRPSTAYDNTGGDDKSDLPFVAWVVEKTRMSDGLCAAPAGDVFDPASNLCIAAGHELVTRFRYRDGRFDAAAREFRGFREVERITEEAHRDQSGAAVDDADNATVSVYGQTDETAGRLLMRITYAGAACATSNPEPDCTTPIQVQWERQQWSTTATGVGRTRVWLAVMDTATLGATGVPQYLKIRNDPPDAYGNILRSTKRDLGDTVLVSAETEFATPFSSTGPQVFDRPKRSATSDGSGVLEERWFFYDTHTNDEDGGRVGAGNVRRVRSRLDVDTPAGPETWTWYDAYGNITKVRDANGHETDTYYDAYDLHPVRVVRAVNDLDQEHVRTFDYRWGLPLSVTDANGATARTSYDALGRPQCRARPGESIGDCPIAYEYHFADGADPSTWVKVIETQDPKPPSGCGGQATPRPPLWTRSVVDALGRARYTDTFRIVDGASATVRSGHAEYDAAGRLLVVYHPYLDGQTPDAGDGERRSYVAPAGHVDPLGRVQRITHSDGASRSLTYAGNKTIVTDEAGHVTESVTDPLGRVIETRALQNGAEYTTTLYNYDGAGRLLLVSQAPGGLLKSMTYDALGRKIEMVDQNSGLWRYGYDGVGNLVWQDDPEPGQHLQHCYDALNRPLRRCAWADDTPEAHTCASACPDTPEKAEYFYDGDDGWAVANAVGRLTRVIDGAGQYDVVGYDARGRETASRRSIVVDAEERHATFAYAYDRNDRLTQTTYPDGEAVLSEYDDSGQPLAVRSTTQFYVIDAAYDRFGRLTRLQHGNGVVDTWSFDAGAGAHRLQRRTTQLPNTAPYLDLLYQAYDPRGLLTQLRDQRDPVGVRTNTADYAYDHLGRLTSADSSHAAHDRLYEYDPLGNITRHGELYFEYDPIQRHQIRTIRDGSPQGPPSEVTHDGNGNRTGKAGQHYTFTAADRVASITAGGQVSEFLYDHAGRQVARRAGGSVTRYYGERAETADGVLTKWYFLGGRRIAMRQAMSTGFETAALGDALLRVATVSSERPLVVVQIARPAGLALGVAGLLLTAGLWLAPGHRRRPVVGIALRRGRVLVVALLWGSGTLPWPLVLQPPPAAAQADVLRHYHLDHLGSTQVITSATGTLLEQLRYHAYGKLRGRWNAAGGALTPGDTGRHEFTGYETQLASGLQYAGARFYDPTLGAFLTHDPLAEFPNPYTYVHWDPVNATDPTGAFEIFTGALLLGLTLAGVVASAVQSALNGASAQQALDHALVGALGGLTFQAAVIGPLSSAFAGAATYVQGAQLAYGAYATVEGFRSRQYVQAGFGAVSLAYGLSTSLTAPTEEVPTGLRDVQGRADVAGREELRMAREAQFEPAANDYKIQHAMTARHAMIESATWITGLRSGGIHFFGRVLAAPFVALAGVWYEFKTALAPLNPAGRYFDQQGVIDWAWDTPGDIVANTLGQLSTLLPIPDSVGTVVLRYGAQVLPGPDHTTGHICPTSRCVSLPGGVNGLP